MTNSQGAEKEDVEAQLEVIKTLEDKYEDLGPVMDVVVFFDGKLWWAALDATETGDLSAATLLTNYRDQFKYGTIGKWRLLYLSNFDIHCPL